MPIIAETKMPAMVAPPTTARTIGLRSCTTVGEKRVRPERPPPTIFLTQLIACRIGRDRSGSRGGIQTVVRCGMGRCATLGLLGLLLSGSARADMFELPLGKWTGRDKGVETCV